jgi:hypothetical protein
MTNPTPIGIIEVLNAPYSGPNDLSLTLNDLEAQGTSIITVVALDPGTVTIILRDHNWEDRDQSPLTIA